MRGIAFFEYRDDKDGVVDTEGALGELVLGQLLGRAKGCSLAPLVDHKPVHAQDLSLGALTLDAKTFGTRCALCTVSKRAHEKKAPHAHVAWKIVEVDFLDAFIVASSAVDGWKLTTEIRGRTLPPERYYYEARLPKLPARPEALEAPAKGLQ